MSWLLNPPNRVRIRHIPGQSVTYLENPKVATRTIESSMWDAHAPGDAPDNPHAEPDRAPFLGADQMTVEPGLSELLESEFFTVVRNPYARFLSAYLDKVQKGAWTRLAGGFGFAPDVRPSPSDLLRAMADIEPVRVNAHFRTQCLTIFHGLAPVDHIGHIERLGAAFAWLAERGVPVRQEPQAVTRGASGLRDGLDGTARDLAREFYAEDFKLFGYSDDPGCLGPVGPVDPGRGTRRLLREALAELA